MALVIAIESEVFVSCVEEIDVSVVVKYGDAWLCYGWKYFSCFGGGKVAQDRQWRREMVPGIGCRCGAV
jgi:hypothetical protein